MTNDDTPQPDERITVIISGEKFEYERRRPFPWVATFVISIGTVATFSIVRDVLGSPYSTGLAVVLLIACALALIFGD